MGGGGKRSGMGIGIGGEGVGVGIGGGEVGVGMGEDIDGVRMGMRGGGGRGGGGGAIAGIGLGREVGRETRGDDRAHGATNDGRIGRREGGETGVIRRHVDGGMIQGTGAMIDGAETYLRAHPSI